MLSIMIWFVGTLVLTGLSWKTLADRRSARFARFLGLVTLWALLVMSAPAWLHQVRLFPGILSWLALAASLLLAFWALYALSSVGGLPFPRTRLSPGARGHMTEAGGPYRRIRHPLLLALILLGWGAAFRVLSLSSIVLALVTTALLAFCSHLKDLENLERFGEEYDRYMERTEIFIPGLF